MAKFVEFIDIKNVNIAVNVDQITVVRPGATSGTFIAFGQDRGVAVDAEYPAVMEALRKA